MEKGKWLSVQWKPLIIKFEIQRLSVARTLSLEEIIVFVYGFHVQVLRFEYDTWYEYDTGIYLSKKLN